MIRVELEVTVGGPGRTEVWWARFHQDDVKPNGIGSGRHVWLRREAQPTWLPKPDWAPPDPSDTELRGRAWVDLEPGAVLRAGGHRAGGARCARVGSPVLVVEEGARWEGTAQDGSRRISIRIRNARPLRLEEIERPRAVQLRERIAQLEAELARLREELAQVEVEGEEAVRPRNVTVGG